MNTDSGLHDEMAAGDAAVRANVRSLLEIARLEPGIDWRLLSLLELHATEDVGTVHRNGLDFSIDGFDVSVSMGGQPPTQILYLLGGTNLIVAAPGEAAPIASLTVAEALEDVGALLELSEHIEA